MHQCTILGLATIQLVPLKLLVTNQNHDTVQNNEVPEKLTKQWIINLPKYQHLFQGIGKFKINPVSVTLQKDARLVQKPPRKVPLAMQQAFKEELDSMEQQGIISKYGH